MCDDKNIVATDNWLKDILNRAENIKIIQQMREKSLFNIWEIWR